MSARGDSGSESVSESAEDCVSEARSLRHASTAVILVFNLIAIPSFLAGLVMLASPQLRVWGALLLVGSLLVAVLSWGLGSVMATLAAYVSLRGLQARANHPHHGASNVDTGPVPIVRDDYPFPAD